MAQMTIEEVTKTILPILSAELDKSVAQKVEEGIRKGLEPVQASQHKWMTELLSVQARPEPAKRAKGDLFAGFCRSLAASSMYAKQGKYMSPAEIAKSWGDHDVAKAIEGGLTKALAAGDPLAGGFLVPEQFSQDLIELLYPISVVRRLGAVVIPMPVGTLRIPKLTSGATGYYIGENANITPSQLATGQVTLTFKKLAALTPISNDLLRYSSPGANAVVRDDMVRAIGQAENTAFLRGTGIASNPRGLRYQAAAANVLDCAGTVSLANTVIDLGRIMQKLMENNIPMTRCGWIFAPRTWRYLTTIQNTNGAYVFKDEMQAGRLWGYPFAVNTGIPINLTDAGGTTATELYFADFADVIIGESMSMSVDASSDAAYYDGANVQAAFSLDQTVVRAITEHDLAVRRAESLVVMLKIAWGA